MSVIPARLGQSGTPFRFAPRAIGRGRLWLALALAALLGLVLWTGASLAYRHYHAAGFARAETALRLTVNALQADLARHEVVPQLVGDLDMLQRLVAEGVNALRAPDRSFLVITHYQRLLDHIKPDVVHIMSNGRIVKSGGPELALEVERNGYGDLLAEVG